VADNGHGVVAVIVVVFVVAMASKYFNF